MSDPTDEDWMCDPDAQQDTHDGEIDTHHLICNFGRHKGTPYTRIPVSYLKWMVREGSRDADIAAAELKRRGTVTPNLEISGHAIDRVSLRCLGIWRSDEDRSGIYSWIIKISNEALKLVPDGTKGDVTIKYNGMKLEFNLSGEWPVLKTVMRI